MRALIILLFTAALAACGFQLRGSQPLPFSTLHIALPEMAELHGMIKRNVEATSPTRIVSTTKEAEASLAILHDQPQKKVLSYDAAGRVREFQLERTFTFRVTDAKGALIIAPSTIIIRRDITFSDAQVLAKEAEEAMLWRDIQADLVQQLIRRLAAAKPVPSSSTEKAR
jgi:LPS-assembly lipoprotein